jgi:beta-fructofuranosidase
MRQANKLDLVIDTAIDFMPSTGKWKAGARHVLRYVGKNELYWDPWILKDGDVYRLFYLRSSNGSIFRSWWDTRSKIYGAISTDMKRWYDMGIMLDIEPELAWEGARLCAGSTYKEDGVYYLFYSAADKGGGGEPLPSGAKVTESIGLATSSDGINWERYANHPCLSADEDNGWYGRSYNGKYNYFHWRDPYIVKDEKSGKYYMFFSSYSAPGNPNQHIGACLGLAVADKMAGPYKLLPPACTPVIEGTNLSPFAELERPQIIFRDGKYHLFFSTFATNVHPNWINKVGEEGITNSSLYWYVSNEITGPFKPVSEKPIVPGSETTGMYGINFFPAPDKPEEYIAYGWRYKVFTLEISPQYNVNWTENSISIT